MPSDPTRTPRLGEILVARGYCTARQIEEALDEQVVYDGRLGTNLIELGIVTEEQLARALAIQFGRPARWGPIAVERSALATMAASGAERWQAVPLKLEGRCLEVLVSELRDPTRLDDLAFATGKEVRPVLVSEARLWELLHRCYGLPYPERRGRIGQRGNEGGLASNQEILADLQTRTGRYTPVPAPLPGTGPAGSVVPRAATPTLARATPVPARAAPPVLTRVTPAPSAAAIPAPTRVMPAVPPPAVPARFAQAAATDEQPARTRVMTTVSPPAPAAAPSRTTPPPLPRPSPPPLPHAAAASPAAAAPAPRLGLEEALVTDANVLAEMQGHAARQFRRGLPDAPAEQDRRAAVPALPPAPRAR